MNAAAFGAQTNTKVSSRINQLLTTLSKPRKKPLVDFYRDVPKGIDLGADGTGIPQPTGQSVRTLEGKVLDCGSEDLLELLKQTLYHTKF